ncbi:MAG: Zn-dependent hydrolase [Saprospiraceae bacterium]
MKFHAFLILAGSIVLFQQCKNKVKGPSIPQAVAPKVIDSLVSIIKKDTIGDLLGKYALVDLTTDTTVLSAKEKQMMPILIEIGKLMDDIFWKEAYGDKSTFLDSLKDLRYREFAAINYGPWDRLDGDKPFLPGTGTKSPGAGFYPKDMTKEEFDQSTFKDKNGSYSIVQRDAKGKLMSVPYHTYFKSEILKASELLKQASALAEDPGLKKYLSLRATALLTDDYLASDLAWMEMKNNTLDIVVGPIESYEDQLNGNRASHEAFVLVKDQEWSKRLSKYTGLLPALQTGIPVDEKYKKEKPGTASDLNAYDAIYYAGDGNSGSKTIAINLPNDERVQAKKGTRRLQLKNTIHAKFEAILKPIANLLIVPDQRANIKADAFFSNVMFHEVAHGLGIQNTINGKGTVRAALKEHYGALEEGKADILGLYMIQQLHKQGEITGEMKDYIVTFVASIFRSIRFGASNAHAKANLIRFNYFKEIGAIDRRPDGTYSVNFEKFDAAVESLTKLILQIQGDGDYEQLDKLIKEKGVISAELQSDLDKLSKANIPVDIIFNQGLGTLGLAPVAK